MNSPLTVLLYICMMMWPISGGYCGVRWDSGQQDLCLFTGLQNEYHLMTVADTTENYDLQKRPQESHNDVRSARSQGADTFTSSCGAGTESLESALDIYAASSWAFDDEDDVDLQKKILAQEVVKLRSEVARLQEQKSQHTSHNDLASIRDQILMLQARKAETIQGREKDKRLLRLEIEKLMHGNTISDHQMGRLNWKERVELAFETHGEAYKTLESFVENAAAEYDLVVMLRHLRHSMTTTSMRHLAGMRSQDKLGIRQLLKISNDSLSKIIADARQLPVKTELELEALRCAHSSLRISVVSACEFVCASARQCA